jgi:dTMP kinase
VVSGSAGRGRFVVLEGIDGSGKSTQARLLAAALRTRGERVVETREPGGTALGEQLRAVVLGSAPGQLADATEVYVFAAARAQLVTEVIRPALMRGEWVVCDRFLESSLAYQGVARGLGIDAVARANELAVARCVPDLVVVVDVPLEVAAARRGGGDRIEAEDAGFHLRVVAGYRELRDRWPERVRGVPGDGSPAQVHRRVMTEVAELR